MDWIEETQQQLGIGMIIMYAGLIFAALSSLLFGTLGIIIWSALHLSLGVMYNQFKFYAVMGVVCLALVFAPTLGLVGTPYLIANHAWTVLFLGNPIYRAVMFFEWVSVTRCRYISAVQAKIAGMFLTVAFTGLACGLCFPITLTIGKTCMILASFGAQLSFMPISLINKSLFLPRVGCLVGGIALTLKGVAIMFGYATAWTIGYFVFSAGYNVVAFLRVIGQEDQIRVLQQVRYPLPDAYTFEDIEIGYKVAVEKRKSMLAAESKLATKLDRLSAGSLEEIKAYLSHKTTTSEEKEKLFLKVMEKNPAGREKVVAYVLQQEKNPAVHIKALSRLTHKECLRLVYNQMVWLNGDIEVALQKISDTPLYRAALSDPDFVSVHQPYVSPVREQLRMRELLKKMRFRPSHAEDHEAQRRAKAVLENNNQNPILVQMLNSKSNQLRTTEEELIEIVHKEIRARLLDDIKATLKLECDPAHQDKIKEKTPHAKEILECIDNNHQGLIGCQSGALAKLRPLIINNNTMQAAVAWRMYDPYAPTGTFPSLLLPSNDTSFHVYSTRAVVNGSVTQKQVADIIRKDTAFCYLKAVYSDKETRGNDAWLRFVGVISSAGRANNNDDTGYGPDLRTCFPGFKTRLGEFLGGDFESKLKQVIGQCIERAFGNCMRDTHLSLAEKQSLYNAVMLLEGVDARTLKIGGYYLASNISQEESEKVKVADPRIADLMYRRKEFISKAFGVADADITRVTAKIVRVLQENWKIAVPEQQIVYYVEYYLLQMYCNKANLANLYQQYVINRGQKIVAFTEVMNPFGKEKPIWVVYKTKVGYETNTNPVMRKILEAQFVTNYMSQVLFAVLIAAGESSEDTDKAVKSVVEVLKYENSEAWKQDQVDMLESKLLDSYLSYTLYAPVMEAALRVNPIDAADPYGLDKIHNLRKEKKVAADFIVNAFKAKQAVNAWKLENLKALQERLLVDQQPILSSVAAVQFGGTAPSSAVGEQAVEGMNRTPISRAPVMPL